jgi:hypothetical protein
MGVQGWGPARCGEVTWADVRTHVVSVDVRTLSFEAITRGSERHQIQEAELKAARLPVMHSSQRKSQKLHLFIQ